MLGARALSRFIRVLDSDTVLLNWYFRTQCATVDFSEVPATEFHCGFVVGHSYP